MAVPISTLRNAVVSFSETKARSLSEARTLGLKTLFLCHSHLDKDLVNGVIKYLSDAGWRVYVDWADTSMPETPNRETATRIKQKIIELDYFLFLATPNSMKSRWCPWEIGYADGKKSIDRILILPTSDNAGSYGNEYLQLYRRIDKSSIGDLRVWEPSQTTSGLLLKDL